MERPSIKQVREAVNSIADVKYNRKSDDYEFFNCFLGDVGAIYQQVKSLGLVRKMSASGIYFKYSHQD